MVWRSMLVVERPPGRAEQEAEGSGRDRKTGPYCFQAINCLMFDLHYYRQYTYTAFLFRKDV
jgi:hypothetical protein